MEVLGKARNTCRELLNAGRSIRWGGACAWFDFGHRRRSINCIGLGAKMKHGLQRPHAKPFQGVREGAKHRFPGDPKLRPPRSLIHRFPVEGADAPWQKPTRVPARLPLSLNRLIPGTCL